MKAFVAFLLIALVADIAHSADGHRCDDDCLYPWGKKYKLAAQTAIDEIVR
jgi:hypothetical protein